jgi:hypothetical protein
MSQYLRNHLLTVILIVVIILLSGVSGYGYFQINRENDTLNQKYLKSQEDLGKANESIKLKDTELTQKNKEIEDLNNKTNKATVSAPSSDSSSSQGSSIYDRIDGSDDFKARIKAALDALQGDGEHFSIASSQVATIFEYDNYGGMQQQRNIYIGAQANDPTITASLISHEAQHVYNVYVDGIYSYGTKEQELPCYEAELATAQRIGAPAGFITSVQNQVNYWQTQ